MVCEDNYMQMYTTLALKWLTYIQTYIDIELIGKAGLLRVIQIECVLVSTVLLIDLIPIKLRQTLIRVGWVLFLCLHKLT